MFYTVHVQYGYLCHLMMLYSSSDCTLFGRHGGLVVSSLDSGLRGLGSNPGRVNVLCSWARYFTLTVPLSTQEHKWVPENCQGNLTKCLG